MTMTIDDRIKSKESDVIYWQRRFDQSRTAYARERLNSAKKLLNDLKWQKENEKI